MFRHKKESGERYSRMTLRAQVVVLRQGELWESQVVDISASGVLIQRPDDWQGSLGDEVSVDLLLADNKTIPLFGRVVRYDADHLGLEFSHIPPTSEIPLWTLLGEYADALDPES